jgi:hypothetical protein
MGNKNGERPVNFDSSVSKLLRVIAWDSKRYDDGARTEHFRRAPLDSCLIKLYKTLKSVPNWDDLSAADKDAITFAISELDCAIEKMETKL